MAVRVQAEDFDVGSEVRQATAGREDIGAVVTFTGTVRGEAKGRKIRSMTLEHYPGMTEAELARVETEAHARWPLDATVIIHRFGELKPGDNIVLVVTASRHRHAAYEANAFLMDYLKSRAPFWKKETLADGSGQWVDARETDAEAMARWGSPADGAPGMRRRPRSRWLAETRPSWAKSEGLGPNARS
ncbi:MAG: molybdenum cofactor biosynthesis protein MoaE [Hyphomicrobiaceae bacterium]